MTGPDVAMLALTLAGFVLIALMPYAAFRLVELAEDAVWRARERAAANRLRDAAYRVRVAAEDRAAASYRAAAPSRTVTASTRIIR